MSAKKISFMALTIIVITSISVVTVFSDDLSLEFGSFNAMSSGYGIGRWNPKGDGNVPLGTEVTVLAGTLYTDADCVVFIWKADEIVQHVEINPIQRPPPSDPDYHYWGDVGTPVYYALSSYTIDVPALDHGWGVQAYFFDEDDCPELEDIVDDPDNDLGRDKLAIRAISFHPFVVPEVPYGAITSLVTMLGAFLVYRRFF